MTTEIILASAVVSTTISIVGTFFLNLYLNRKNFKNDYFRIVIQKRIETYELLEDQISLLKVSVLDTTNKNPRPYHQIFSLGHQHLLKTTINLSLANGRNIWMNSDTRDKLTEILNLVNKIGLQYNDDAKLIEGGRTYYWELARLRDELEQHVQEDILKLYDFKKIKKNQNNATQEIRM